MKWTELFPSSVPPLLPDIDKFVSCPLWNEFCASVEGAYGVSPRIEYSRCSMAPGWNVKYKKGGKSICTVYPNNGRFFCMLVIVDKKTDGRRTDHEFVRNIYAGAFSQYTPIHGRQVAVY